MCNSNRCNEQLLPSAAAATTYCSRPTFVEATTVPLVPELCDEDPEALLDISISAKPCGESS